MPIAFCFSQCKQSIDLIKPKDLPYFLNKKNNIYPLRKKSNFYNSRFTGPVMDYKSIFSYILNSDFKPDINPPSFYNQVVKNYFEFIKNESIKKFKYVITLTLRSYEFQQARNTLSEDIDFLNNFCIKNKILLIIVPDTDRVPTKEQNLILKKYKNVIWDAPSHCIFLRLSLYQESLLNIMNLNGPMALSILSSKSRSIILNFGDETHSSNAGKSFSEKEYGIQENSQPYSRFSCLLQWNKLDNLELEEHIKKLCPELGI